MIIRHAEKPDDDNDIHLSREGQQRAWALAGLFDFGSRLGVPQFLFAADKSKHSNRSVETLTPLSRRLLLDIDHGFSDDEYRDLAKRLKSGKKYAGAIILICWHHGTIPALARALGVPVGSLPDGWGRDKKHGWPDDVFDRVWIIDLDPPGLVAIRSEPQGLDS